MKKLSIIVVAFLCVGFFLTVFGNKISTATSTYSFSHLETSLTPEEFQSALRALGLTVEKYNYNIPRRHTIHFTVQQFINGEPKPVRGVSSSSSSSQGGQHTLMVFMNQKEEEVRFSFGIDGSLMGFKRVSTEGYHAYTASFLRTQGMKAGERIPLFAFVANKNNIMGFGPDEPLQDIIAKYELVAIAFAELQPN